ncbi:hypothetical protein ACED51_22960 [Photobacterium swingsii]
MDEVMQMVKSKDFAKPKKLKQNDELEKENDILKKWQRYQVEQRRKASDL